MCVCVGVCVCVSERGGGGTRKLRFETEAGGIRALFVLMYETLAAPRGFVRLRSVVLCSCCCFC